MLLGDEEVSTLLSFHFCWQPCLLNGKIVHSLSSACFGRLLVNPWSETQIQNNHRIERII
jgi:hypothetical protein